MRINMEVALAADFEIEQAVAREQVEQ